MKSLNNNPSLAHWQPDHDFPHGLLTPTQWHWLIDLGSLTQRLRQFTQNTISHQLNHEDWKLALQEESDALHLPHDEMTWVREIDWMFGDATWVCGRVIIPKSTFTNEGGVLKELQGRSLGDTLFNTPHTKRSPIELCQLPAQHDYYQRACQHIKERPEFLWARRSVFHFHHRPLLVCETFLPSLFQSIRE